MEEDNYKFIPAPGAPTVKKLSRMTYLMIGLVTVGCILVALFSKPAGNDLFIFITYIVLCLFVIVSRFSLKYTTEVQIDPVEGVLYYFYMNHQGEISKKKIIINHARYSYKPRASVKYPGYVLTIQDNNARMQIGETRSNNKDITNVFYKSQLDEMNRIILTVKGQTE
jgi:hypothetical protein